MKLAILSAALLAFACSSGTTETRTTPIPSSTYGAAATNTPASAEQAPGVSGPVASKASVSPSTGDSNTGVRTVMGPVAEIQKDGIRFGPGAGNLVLKVDSSTKILRSGVLVSEGLAAIHEGEQVRASFDVSQNRATRIDLMGRSTDLRQDKNGGEAHPQWSPPPTDATTTPH